MWKAKRVASTAAQNMQVDAGLLLNTFDPTNPVAPADEDIICATTGDFAITSTPDVSDFFDDVNNAQKNTKSGKRITGWTCTLGITGLEVTEDMIKLALGAARELANGGISPRAQYELSDFKDIWWIGDMVDTDNLFAVKLANAVSTGGISFSSTNNGKGKLAMTFTGHTELGDEEYVPMEFYVLEKVDEDAPEYTYTAVSPVGTENPHTEGWYVLNGDRYQLTNDTAVDTNKTYYEREEVQGA